MSCNVVVTILFLSLCCSNLICSADRTDIVHTTNGPVRGEILKTVDEKILYSSFNGIPYANPPVGNLRFQPPVQADKWTRTLQAVGQRKGCPQFDTEYIGDEDCLFVNVYTPQTEFNEYPNHLRSVMVWIHGGLFTKGSANSSFYGPDFLLEKNVVVVYINYRLGALGFLSLNHPNATGNAGLKDQLLALKWVQSNIKKFGGDPNRVTIFGHGSGAVSVELLKLSDKSKGLYRRSIAMSGSPLSDWGLSSIPEAKRSAERLMNSLRLTGYSTDEMLKALTEVPVEDIIIASEEMFQEVIKEGLSFELLFKPVVEDERVSRDAIVTGNILEKYQRGDCNHVPHMIGYTNAEVAGLFPPTLRYFPGVSTENAGKLLDNLVTKVRKRQEPTRSLSAFLNQYDEMKAGNITYSVMKKAIMDEAIQVTSKYFFVSGIQQTQWYCESNRRAPIYYYRNSFNDERLPHIVDGLQLGGVGHHDDLTEIFWMPSLNVRTVGPLDRFTEQRKKMVKMLTNFAKFGNPNPRGAVDPLLIKWTPSRFRGGQLSIGDTLSMNYRKLNRTMWN